MNMTGTIDAGTARTDLIPASVPVFVVFLLVLAGVLLWGAARYLTTRYRDRLPLYGVVGPRVGMATIAMWCGIQLLGRFCALTGPWPVWLAAVIGAVLIEGTAEFYRHERQAVSRRLGAGLTLLRGLALLLAVVVMLQPVRVWTAARNISRRVVVLVDDSESMNFTDRQWTTSEMVELGLHAQMLEARERPLPALSAVSDWSSALQPWVGMESSTNTADELVAVLENTLKEARELAKQIDTLLGEIKDDAPGVKTTLQRLRRHMDEGLIAGLVSAREGAEANELNPRSLRNLIRAAERTASMVSTTHLAVDTLLWRGLENARREEITAYCTTTRVALASAVLADAPKGEESLLERLGGRYDVDLLRLGMSVKPLSREELQGDAPAKKAEPAEEQAFRSLTDYPTVLEGILNDTPAEELAGVLILSDGRNNGAAGLAPVGRRYGLQGVPVCGVVVGGSRLPRDVAIAEVQAPESVFLGDLVRVNVTVKVTGARGSRIKLTMTGAPDGGSTNEVVDGEVVLDEEQIDVFTDNYTRELRLTHEPKAHGIYSYKLQADVQEGELFTTNNAWQVDVAVSDDRNNVLLVDQRPRWEFRYLRNLFFGRDKSVHLQYFLVQPDRAGGVTALPLPPASAARKFGDAESGSLPVSREEWRKFDMIILGDLDAKTLTPEVLADIRHCVTERGTLLVVIAGPENMPRTFDEEILREMLPVDYEMQLGDSTDISQLSSRLRLTVAGKSHPVMQQSDSYSENEVIWDDMQELTWRFPVLEVKPGAESLAYAEPTVGGDAESAVIDASGAADQLDRELRERARNALVVVQDYGRGKVMMLNFDQTWRLRFKIGDTYHHRLWGQIMRWGVGEKLRAGEDGLRLGTDKLIYTPGQTPRVLARVTDTNFVGVVDAELDVSVSLDDEEVARVEPVYREGSHGMYEVVLPPCEKPGRYELLLKRNDRGRSDEVKTAFVVVLAERSVELSDVTATRKDLALLGRLTGGRVVGPDRAAELWDAFGEGRTQVKERHERTVWDRPWVLLALLGLLTTEWLLRKRGGLT